MRTLSASVFQLNVFSRMSSSSIVDAFLSALKSVYSVFLSEAAIGSIVGDRELSVSD